MRLIIREYLASLKERDELDAILPGLLSEMGYHVFSRAQTGTRQYGVDIAASKKVNRANSREIYLFVLKSGDIGRNNWYSGGPQGLRATLEELVDSYLPCCIPIEYHACPVKICICCGGNIAQEVQLNIAMFINKKSTQNNNKISFEIWDGDKLAHDILSRCLHEHLLPLEARSLLRKSLAMLDDPETSCKIFKRLVESTMGSMLIDKIDKKSKKLRTLYICMWVLYAWCREANNIESAYLSSELLVLHTWNIYKDVFPKKGKNRNAIIDTWRKLLEIHQKITIDYLGHKVLPFINKRNALSFAVRSSNDLDVNQKLFDILGRISMAGIWTLDALLEVQLKKADDKQIIQNVHRRIQYYSRAIMLLISNNKMLSSPYKDEQIIDISMAICVLSQNPVNYPFIHDWIEEIISRARFAYITDDRYPCTIDAYEELLAHPFRGDISYKKRVTCSSLLYPTLMFFAALLQFDDVYNSIRDFAENDLQHCDFQFWLPDLSTEESFYTNEKQRLQGLSLIKTPRPQAPSEFLSILKNLCDNYNSIWNMSVCRHGYWPLLFLGCRHYRLPLAPHLCFFILNTLPNEEVPQEA